MYTPALFRITDAARLFDLIEAHPFGMIVGSPEAGDVEITHVPFVLDRDVGSNGTLRFHVARANPVWRAATQGRPVVVVFSGPHGYISASWYEKPREEVPTWNYAVVHVHGRVEGPMTKDATRRLLADLAAINEAGSAAPWRIDELSAALVDELLDEIVGLSLPISRLEGKFKLSQNRSAEDQRRVLESLRERAGPDDLEMLGLMG